MNFVGKAFDEIAEGDEFGQTLTIDASHISRACGLFGDFNPLHSDATFCAGTRFGQPILHGPMTSALMSASIGMFFYGTAIAYLGSVDVSFAAATSPAFARREARAAGFGGSKSKACNEAARKSGLVPKGCARNDFRCRCRTCQGNNHCLRPAPNRKSFLAATRGATKRQQTLEHNCRFLAPVYAGDTLTTAWVVTATQAKPRLDGGIATLVGSCRNQRGEVVAEADGKIMLGNRLRGTDA